MSEQHFEHIWNAAEFVAHKSPDKTVSQIVDDIKIRLDKLAEPDRIVSQQGEILGEIVFDLCSITHKLGINSAQALRLAIENRTKLLENNNE